jgi:hypothetical protein
MAGLRGCAVRARKTQARLRPAMRRADTTCQGINAMGHAPHEPHSRIPELSKLWGFSRQVTIRLCRDEPGVIKLCKARGCRGTLSVPARIARVIDNRVSEVRSSLRFRATTRGA